MDGSDARRRWTDGRLALGAALVLGLAIRLAVLSQSSGMGIHIVDERHYSTLAQNLLEGHGFAWSQDRPTSVRPPLFPAMLAGIWSVTGAGNLQAVRVAQIVLALITTALVYQLGRRVFGAPAGRFAAAIFWLYPSLIFFNFTILTETVFTGLLVAFVLLSVMLVDAPRAWIAGACGIVLGAAALTRSVMWPLPIVFCPLVALLLRGPWRVRLAMPALILAGYALVVAPWAVRNTRLQGVLTFVDTMGGVNLRLGNYEHTPEDRMWAGIDTLTGEKEWSYELAQDYPGQKFTEGQKDKWAQQQAVAYILENPGISARRAMIKFADLWGIEREFIAGVQHGLFAPPAWFAALAAAAIVLAYVFVACAGVAGMWLGGGGWRSRVMLLLPVALVTAVHTVTFGHSRYHLPLIPIFAIFAAALLAQDRWWWQPRRAMWLGAAASVLLLVGIWVRQFVIVDAARIGALFGNGG